MPEPLIQVAPDVLNWAIRRSGKAEEGLQTKFPDLDEWIAGASLPTLGKLEKFANATHTPIGNFFLKEPPVIDLGLTDFRTIGNARITEPSPNLIDTLALCEQRQEWYRNHAIDNGFEGVELTGSLSLPMTVEQAAAELHRLVAFDLDVRQDVKSLEDAWSALAAAIENAGVLVMKNGVVGNNTKRKLDPDEFRGFALADDLAPLIFVNGVDSKAAVIFTLAHELVHIGLGISSISNFAPTATMPSQPTTNDQVEQWCSQVAAEFLIPGEFLKQNFRSSAPLGDEVHRLAKTYKVSTVVLLQKLYDDRLIDWSSYRKEYGALTDAWSSSGSTEPRKRSGGNTYNNIGVRAGKTFARALLADTRAGNTLYSDALRLLGLKKGDALNSFAEHLGVA
jgi:Zn-dependent peptidase ImmA (M78 family)